jgi:DNA helicase-2/ATP-dependent DNA helicase PcrA
MLKSINGNLRIGHSDYIITEACEYTNSFLSLISNINIILNVREDHLDFFKDIDDIRNSFKLFADKTEENTNKLYNISELKNSAVQFKKDNPTSNLADYLNSVTLSSDTDEINDGEMVTIATIHAVKGLEYKTVFVAGLDEKILPISRSANDEDELEEERRLMYVAVTRAKERLYLTRAMSRYLYGYREHMVQSRFLKEAQSILSPNLNIEKKYETNNNYRDNHKDNYRDFDEEKSYTSNLGYSSNYAKSMLNTNKPKANVGAQFSKYKSGTKVKHVKFGMGTVIQVKGEGDNLIVDVAFLGVGIKSLSVKYAPMEIING